MKKKVSKKNVEKYLSKPNLEKVKRYVKKEGVPFKSEIIKKTFNRKRAYERQQAEIEAGLKPPKVSKTEKRIQKLRQKLGKLSKRKIKVRKVLRKSKTSYTMPKRPIENVLNLK